MVNMRRGRVNLNANLVVRSMPLGSGEPNYCDDVKSRRYKAIETQGADDSQSAGSLDSMWEGS